MGHRWDMGHGWEMGDQTGHGWGKMGHGRGMHGAQMDGARMESTDRWIGHWECVGGDGWDRDEPCRDTVLGARWGLPTACSSRMGGPQRAPGRDVGTHEVAGGWHVLPGSPQYSREGRGDPSRRGSRAALEVPVQEEDDAEPPAVPQPGAQSPRGINVPPPFPPPTPLTGSPLAPASPAGPRSPWRPFGGRREELQGVSSSPCPGLCPPGSTTGQSAGGQEPGHGPWGL